MHCQCLFVKPVCFPLSAPFVLPDLPLVVTCWVCKVDMMGRGAGGVPRQKGPFQPPPCSAAFPGCSPGSVQRCSGLVGWRSGASSSRDPSRALGSIMRPFSFPCPPQCCSPEGTHQLQRARGPGCAQSWHQHLLSAA